MIETDFKFVLGKDEFTGQELNSALRMHLSQAEKLDFYQILQDCNILPDESQEVRKFVEKNNPND
jgi:hypothetical protein